jgi:hypothetical protein
MTHVSELCGVCIVREMLPILADTDSLTRYASQSRSLSRSIIATYLITNTNGDGLGALRLRGFFGRVGHCQLVGSRYLVEGCVRVAAKGLDFYAIVDSRTFYTEQELPFFRVCRRAIIFFRIFARTLRMKSIHSQTNRQTDRQTDACKLPLTKRVKRAGVDWYRGFYVALCPGKPSKEEEEGTTMMC